VSTTESLVTIIGLAAITLVTRSFFLFSSREFVLPQWVQRGLRYAPLAALSAVVAPEVLMTQGQFIGTWQDARIYAALAGAGCYLWRRSLLGTILSGMAVFLALKFGLGW
jgi:branched-subunit amino acid transport protein